MNLINRIKKVTKKNKTIHAQWAYYLPTLALLVVYGIFLYLIWRTGALKPGDLINNATVLVGWIVTLLVALIYLGRSRKDNQRLKKEEVRRSLEIDAFREINRTVTSFGSSLAEASSKFLWWPYDLKMHRKNPRYHEFQKAKIESEAHQQRIGLLSGLTDFLLAIEANEIAVIQFDYLRKYIHFRVDDVNEFITEFSYYLMTTKKEVLLTEPGYRDFKEKCEKMREGLSEIASYLFDYRIELMNSMLGETFSSQVPIRKPRDPKCKILTEVAIKEEVEKETERRELRMLNKAEGKNV